MTVVTVERQQRRSIRARLTLSGVVEEGQILCQNVVEFGGTWLVVRPSGSLVR